MSHKFGFPAMTNRALGNKPSTPSSSSSKGGKVLVRVIDIILDENHPDYRPNSGLTQIGQITAEAVSINSSIRPRVYIATPAFPDKKNLPLVNEYVYVYQIIGPNSIGGSWVYDPQPISLYGMLSPNSNQYPTSTFNPTPSSQTLNYSQVESGATNIVDNQPTELNPNSKTNPSQDTFVEKGNIHPLMPFAGDIIYEGRFGNSLRFGNTAKSKSQFANNWSSAGNNGDPIMILRNGQDPNASDFGAEFIVENIKKDLSSIYLTSTQKLSDLGLANENFNSYKIKPILPSTFTSPQIALSSDRIVLNAKRDSVLISGQSSIGLSTNGSVNIDTPSLYISSNDIRLGSNNATQPVLLGDDTVDVLKELTFAIKDLATILQVQRDYPEGKLVTSYNAIAGNAIVVLDSIIKTLNDNSLKSQTTKVR